MGDKRPCDKVAPIHRVDEAYLKSAIDKNADPRRVEQVETIRKDRARRLELAKQARIAADKKAADRRRKRNAVTSDPDKSEAEEAEGDHEEADADHADSSEPILNASVNEALGEILEQLDATATTEEVVEADPEVVAVIPEE